MHSDAIQIKIHLRENKKNGRTIESTGAGRKWSMVCWWKTTYSNLARVLRHVPPSHGLSPAFLAGRPRIKCNNASSSGWRARIHLSLTRVEAHDCVPGMRDDYFVRNAPRRPYAKTGAPGKPQLCSLQPRSAAKKPFPLLLFPSLLSSLFSFLLSL